jgi:hypothetical protein
VESFQSRLTGTYYGMQDLYDIVRATGAKNVVMISGLDYCDIGI